MFISILYMFQAAICPSSGELILSIRHLVYVTLYRLLSGVQVWVKPKPKFCRKIFRTYGSQWLAISVVLTLSARKRSSLRVEKNSRMDSVRGGYRSEDWIDFYRESAKEKI